MFGGHRQQLLPTHGLSAGFGRDLLAQDANNFQQRFAQRDFE